MKTRHLLLLALLAAYVHLVAFPFYYGVGQHEFQLAMVNWLRDPALYPNDPITDAFANYPSLFWRVVATLTDAFGLLPVLFAGLAVFHFLTFWGLARLAAGAVESARLVAVLVFAAALSPLLVTPTPFGGGGGIFGGFFTHSLAVGAVLIWSAVFLLERRWVPAAVLLGLAMHIHLLYAVHFGFAFAALWLFDLRTHARRALAGAGVLALFAAGWVVLNRAALGTPHPEGYVEALLSHYPYHLTLSSRPEYDLLRGAFVLLAIGVSVLAAVRHGVERLPRLELLAASFVVPIALGAVVGEWLRIPQLLLLQFLRADTFLFLFGVVLAQIYGARLLAAGWMRPASAVLLGLGMLLLPLSEGRALPAFLVLAAVVAVEPFALFDRVARFAARWRGVVLALAALAVLGFAAFLILYNGEQADPAQLVAVATLAAGGAAFAAGATSAAAVPGRLAALTAAVVLLATTMLTVPAVERLWQPVRPVEGEAAAWRELQHWARANTPRDAQFLVPPFPGGFRVFSERSCWVSWKDGDIFWMYPPYAPEWLRRYAALGAPLEVGRLDPDAAREAYMRKRWEELQALAEENHLAYIVQYAAAPYPREPVFANRYFAVYSPEADGTAAPEQAGNREQVREQSRN